MKKVLSLDPEVSKIMGTTYQLGDYEEDDGETCFAIVNTPGYETLTIDGEHLEDVEYNIRILAIERHIVELEYPAWYFNAGTIQMRNKQAEEIDLLGTRDRYRYSVEKMGVFDRLVTRFTRLTDPDNIYPFPIEQEWDQSQIDAAMDELIKSIPWDENYHTLQEKLRAQIAKILESQSEIKLPDLTKIYRIEHGEIELNEYIEIASRSSCHLIDSTVQDSINFFEDEFDESPTIHLAPKIIFRRSSLRISEFD